MLIFPSLPSAGVLFALGFVASLLNRAYYVYNRYRKAKGIPVYWCFIDPLSPVHMLFPRTWWNPSSSFHWHNKQELEKRNTEIIHFIPLFLGEARMQVASPEVIREVYTNMKAFSKEYAPNGLNIMGPNVAGCVGEQWRRHRKITAPAFDGQIYQDVWDTSSRIYKEMSISDSWQTGDAKCINSFDKLMSKLALLVVSACGFHMKVSWEGDTPGEGLSSSMTSSIYTVTSNILPIIVLPRWMGKGPFKGLRNMFSALDRLQLFLNNKVDLKMADIAEDKKLNLDITRENRNLFARIVMASQEEGARGLSREEITGNLFIYLFAGHETTASTLTSTFALLAVHQDEQQRVHEHIKYVAGDRELTYEDYNALAPVLHCFFEALRLFPSGTNMMRFCVEDTSVSSPNIVPGSSSVIIPSGTYVSVEMVNANRNARHFVRPHEFLPQRWAAEGSSTAAAMDGFVGFGAGPRLCLGKRFSTVEAVAFLSNALLEWKFEPKLEHGESVAQWEERVMVPSFGVTLKLNNVPLVVTRRQ